MLGRLRPRAVVGFGGYPTVPPLIAAWLMGVPSVLHEQNAVMGRANRFLAPRVTLIATGFPELKGVDAALAPSRATPAIPCARRYRRRGDALPRFRRRGGSRVLVTGGSQGARVMADVVPAALALLTRGRAARDPAHHAGARRGQGAGRCGVRAMGFPVEIAEFFPDLPARIAASHLVVGRAGASTVSELAVIGRPSVLVPFPHALDQDQAANAAALARGRRGDGDPQTEFTPERLAGDPARRAGRARALRRGAGREGGGRRRRGGAAGGAGDGGRAPER